MLCKDCEKGRMDKSCIPFMHAIMRDGFVIGCCPEGDAQREEERLSHEPRPKGATVRGMTEGDG